MARRKNKNRTRDNTSISNQWLRFENQLLSPSFSSPINLNEDFSENQIRDLQDDRRYHPQKRTQGLRRSSTQLVSGGINRNTNNANRTKTYSSSSQIFQNSAPAKLAFKTPSEVSTCVRRKQRTEVLHALRQTGRGGQKKPVWKDQSHIQCKRRK